jgi:hypothetical protein
MTSSNSLRNTAQDIAGWLYAALCFVWIGIGAVSDLSGTIMITLFAGLGGFAIAVLLMLPALVLPDLVRRGPTTAVFLFMVAWCIPLTAIIIQCGAIVMFAERDLVFVVQILLGFVTGVLIIFATLPASNVFVPVHETTRRHKNKHSTAA